MTNAPGSTRRLWAGERDKVQHHLSRLDGADRQLRFGGHASPARIAAYCAELDFSRALVLGYLVEGEVRAIGELKLLAGRWPRAAEIAISVEGPYRAAASAASSCAAWSWPRATACSSASTWCV